MRHRIVSMYACAVEEIQHIVQHGHCRVRERLYRRANCRPAGSIKHLDGSVAAGDSCYVKVAMDYAPRRRTQPGHQWSTGPRFGSRIVYFDRSKRSIQTVVSASGVNLSIDHAQGHAPAWGEARSADGRPAVARWVVHFCRWL